MTAGHSSEPATWTHTVSALGQLYELYSSDPQVGGGSVEPVEYPNFSMAKLRGLSDEYYFAAECSACNHGLRLSISKLCHTLGEAYPVVQVRTRLRCVHRGPQDEVQNERARGIVAARAT